MKLNTKIYQKGFTLMDSLVSIAIFVMMVTVVNSTASAIIRETKNFRENTSVSTLADQYLEIARNLPYSQIGTFNGNPHGNLPDEPNAVSASINGKNYLIYYVVNYIDDPADGTIIAGTDPAPNDYRQIKLYIKNVSTGATKSFLSTIAPKGLESMNGGGALSVKD
jgi:type II secretory pathway pseudopilin PulG